MLMNGVKILGIILLNKQPGICHLPWNNIPAFTLVFTNTLCGKIFYLELNNLVAMFLLKMCKRIIIIQVRHKGYTYMIRLYNLTQPWCKI